MFLIMQLSFFARRKNDSLTSLFLAADIICIISPYSIFDIGFILSFFATLGIITIAVPIINLIRIKNKFIKWVINCFIVTISANTFVLPITAIYFNSISIISPISNLIFIPILTITIYCSFIYLAFYFVPLRLL
jgi:competence protein ComEC